MTTFTLLAGHKSPVGENMYLPAVQPEVIDRHTFGWRPSAGCLVASAATITSSRPFAMPHMDRRNVGDSGRRLRFLPRPCFLVIDDRETDRRRNLADAAQSGLIVEIG